MKLNIFFIIVLYLFFISCDNQKYDKKCYNNIGDLCECENCIDTCYDNLGNSCECGKCLDNCNIDADCKNGQFCDTNICKENSELCKDINCLFGKCQVKNKEPFCQCNDGYESDGLRCIKKDECYDISCSNQGRCKIDNENPYCECSDGYKDVDLSCKENFCYGINCAGHGRCIEKRNPETNNYDIPKCICDWGYRESKNNFLSCEKIDQCEYMVCNENEICRNGLCLVNDSFCSTNNECTNTTHCWPIIYHDELKADYVKRDFEFTTCKQFAHIAVIPKSSKWRIELENLDETTKLFIYDAHFLSQNSGFSPIYISENAQNGKIIAEFEAMQSGEHAFVIERTNVFKNSSYKIRAKCIKNCKLKTTRFPIVLIHGYAGADRYFGLVDYFWRVKKSMKKLGYSIFTTHSNPIADSEIRAVQVKEQLEDILSTTGARKLNLIAHSQGGLDSRIIISSLDFAKYIKSLTTIATPHHGIGIPMERFISFQNFSPEYAENIFNPRYPNIEGIKYWSYSFRSCGVLDGECQDNSNGEIIDVLLIPTYKALQKKFGDNDGVVPTASMIWGEHLGTLFADHFDEIGHIFDSNDSENDAFRHIDFYNNEAKRLREYGY